MMKKNIETDASGVGLEAGQLRVRDRMNCPKDTAPGNIILWHIMFASQNLSNAETHYSNIKRRHPRDPE